MNSMIKAEEFRTVLENVPAAKSIFAKMAQRQRDRSETNIDRTYQTLKQEGVILSEEDLKKFYEFCQEKGLGKLVFGRNGHADRFDWNASQKRIGEAVLAGADLNMNEPIVTETETVEVMSKRRGRPPGSKNRKKLVARSRRGPGRPAGTKNKSVAVVPMARRATGTDPIVTFQMPARTGQLPLSKLNELNALIDSYLK